MYNFKVLKEKIDNQKQTFGFNNSLLLPFDDNLLSGE